MSAAIVGPTFCEALYTYVLIGGREVGERHSAKLAVKTLVKDFSDFSVNAVGLLVNLIVGGDTHLGVVVDGDDRE